MLKKPCKLLVAAMLLIGMASGQEKIRVLLVTGANNHDWVWTSAHLKKELERTGRFDVTMTAKPRETFKDAANVRDFDVLFMDYNHSRRWSREAEENFESCVSSGTGLVIMHAANNAFSGWRPFETMCALCWRQGTGHGRFHPFDVDVDDRNHPITAGLPPMKGHPDELYHKLKHMHGARFHTLMSAHSSKESGGTGKREPMALITRYGKGRIFHTPLGHVWRKQIPTRASLKDPHFLLLLSRGTEWAATGACTLGPKDFGLQPLKAAQRAHDPWVFRCVLDKRARMIVVALDPQMWLAYDAETCTLYKAWGGRIDLKGSVYDDAHGPQPASTGAPYFVGVEPWKLVHKAESREPPVPLTPHYLGYRVKGKESVTLQWGFARPGASKPTIFVDETPEHAATGGPSLERAFVVKGLGKTERLLVPVGGANSTRREFTAELKPPTYHYHVVNVAGKAHPTRADIVNGRKFKGFPISEGRTVLRIIHPLGVTHR